MRKTNVQIITDLMEFSQFGALAQLFVMDALGKYAKRIAEAPAEALAAMEGGMISPKAWQGVAREIAQKLDAHLGPDTRAAQQPGATGASDPHVEGPDEDELADWISRQIEDGNIKLEDIPRLMAKYALAEPQAMAAEFAERMEMQRDAAASPAM